MTTPPMPSEDPAGAKIVRAEVEVPATLAQVWNAIATGPGIAAWFVPAEVDEREGGAIVTHHGDYGDSTGVVTAWEPPHRFAYEERDWLGDGRDVPPWATEILVEARAGGTCVVRLASGIFSGADEWGEEMIEPTREGWRQGLAFLRLYMLHFAGEPTSSLIVMHRAAGTRAELWARLLDALELHDAAAGQRRTAAADAPPLAGVVEETTPEHLILRSDAPAPGTVVLSVYGEQDCAIVVRGYLYGAAGAAALAQAEPAWRAWLAQRFP